MPGPVPKRSDQRRRRNKPDGPELVQIVASSPEQEAPATPDTWHSLVMEWFDSLKVSGQAVFYQPSDWATAKIAGQALSDALNSGDLKASMLAEFNAMATNLMTTEGARRRLRVELQGDGGPKVDEESRSIMTEYKDMLG